MDTNTRPTDSPANGRRNQRHAPEFKRAVVEQPYLPGSSMARLAREHGINANQIFAWRKQYHDAGLTRASTNTTVLLPVHVAKSVPDDAVPAIKVETHLTSTIELQGWSCPPDDLRQPGCRQFAHNPCSPAAMIGLQPGEVCGQIRPLHSAVASNFAPYLSTVIVKMTVSGYRIIKTIV